MPDPNPTSDTTPDTATAPAANTDPNTQPAPPPETPPTRSTGLWNKKHLEEMSKCERHFNQALTEPYKTIFIRREIPEAKIQGLLTKITAARNQTATAGQSANAVGGITLTEAEAEVALLTDIRTVQGAAKQKHARTNPEVLEDWMVGTDVTESRSAMEQGSQSLIGKLGDQDLPGIDTEFVEQMTDKRKTYVNVNVTQGAQSVQAFNDRLKRDEFIEEIKDGRIEIQYAIDAEFSPTNPDNAAVRRLFDLPPNRPFHAVKGRSA